MIENGKRLREVELEDAKNKCEELGIYWGGECSNKEFTKEKYIEIFKGFVKIIYSKIGNKDFASQSIVKLEIKPKKKHNNCPCIIF